MITRKSNIRYKVIFTPIEYEKVMDLMGTSISALCGLIYYDGRSRWYEVYFTRKQYKAFKRLWNETKNKK